MDKDRLTIVLIDDDRGDAELLRRLLDDHPDREIQFLPFTDSESGLEEIRRRNVDVVFIDYLLGPETGLDALRTFRRRGVQTPVIMLTGQGDEEVAVEAMKAGAADYLIKGRLSRDTLHRSLANVLEKAHLHQMIEAQRMELERYAQTDELTGLFNRRYFMERLEHEIARAVEEKQPISLLMIDLDHFKKVNDTYGHLVGDMVLQRAAVLIRDTIGARNLMGRFGGEEFCVVLADTPLGEAREIAEGVCKQLALQRYRAFDGREFGVTCSIGVADLGSNGTSLTDWIRTADDALYRAKDLGRNSVCSE